MFGPLFYLTLALLLGLLAFMWRWYLRKESRTGTDTFLVMVASAIGVAPLLLLLYLLFAHGRLGH